MLIQGVIIHRSAFLQAVSDRVRFGYHYCCTGTVSADRATAWVRKASRYYAVDLDRNRRARAKRRGEGCAYLLFHQIEPTRLLWVLLVSDGDHPAHRLERLRDALDPEQRLELFGYELIRITKPAVGHPVWTWRFSSSAYDALRARIIETVRRGDEQQVRQLIASLYASVGFRGVRSQIGRAAALMNAEWRRRHGNRPLPKLPKLLPYVQRLRHDSIPLSIWLAAQSRVAQ